MTTRDIRLDFQRKERIGFEEAILCPGKTREHLDAILEEAGSQGRALLLTRMSREQVDALRPEHRARLDYEPLSRTAYFGEVPAIDAKKTPRVAIVAAGTSDAFVTREIARTLAYAGEPASEFVDVGLAGLWRVVERIDDDGTATVDNRLGRQSADQLAVKAPLLIGFDQHIPPAPLRNATGEGAGCDGAQGVCGFIDKLFVGVGVRAAACERAPWSAPRAARTR